MATARHLPPCRGLVAPIYMLVIGAPVGLAGFRPEGLPQATGSENLNGDISGNGEQVVVSSHEDFRQPMDGFRQDGQVIGIPEDDIDGWGDADLRDSPEINSNGSVRSGQPGNAHRAASLCAGGEVGRPMGEQ